MKRIRVAGVDEVPPGEARVVEAEGRALAVVNVGGAFFAIDNACGHRGGPLGEGNVEGAVLTCPWHAWRWDVRTGANVNNPAVKLACYPVTVENGALLVDLP
jgi:nitrite reductase/ring-hydroxylating ferredoxin subunit